MKLFTVIVLTLGFTQCVSVKFDQKPPFTVTNATYANWVGGIEGVSGTNVKFYYVANTKIVFEEIFYNGKKTQADLKKDNKGNLIVGHFKNITLSKADLQMHSDLKQEYGNRLPEKVEGFPFDLKPNEAVISFKEKGKTRYYKVENIKREKPSKN